MSPAYLAGLFDGEGHIHVQQINGTWHLALGIDNTFEPVIGELHVTFGGTKVLKRGYSAKHQPCHHWRLSNSRSVREVLAAMLPELRVKRQQALLALEFLRIENVSGTPLTQEEHIRRSALAQQIKALRGKGLGED